MKRSLRIKLNKTDKTTQIILGYITYHVGKLWNEVNFLVKNKLAKPNIFDLYSKLIEKEKTSYIVDGKEIQSLLRKYLKKLAKWQKKRDNLLNKGLPTNKVDKILHRIQKRINNLIF